MLDKKFVLLLTLLIAFAISFGYPVDGVRPGRYTEVPGDPEETPIFVTIAVPTEITYTVIPPTLVITPIPSTFTPVPTSTPEPTSTINPYPLPYPEPHK